MGAGASAANGGAAFGDGAVATGCNATAIGTGASAMFANSSAFGAGASATAANQMAFGTASNTYRMPGITSAESLAAQSGPTSFVTTDASGNLAATSFGPQQMAQGMQSLYRGGAPAQFREAGRSARRLRQCRRHLPCWPRRFRLRVLTRHLYISMQYALPAQLLERCRAAEQRDELAALHWPMPSVLPTERIAHLGTIDCCIHPPGRNEMIAITPPIISSKEVAQK
jgi:hypothetical protein